jgi:hypothetical protein
MKRETACFRYSTVGGTILLSVPSIVEIDMTLIPAFTPKHHSPLTATELLERINEREM